jgi:hypothetical protein
MTKYLLFGLNLQHRRHFYYNFQLQTSQKITGDSQ